jgi:hypothetical protein
VRLVTADDASASAPRAAAALAEDAEVAGITWDVPDDAWRDTFAAAAHR